MSFTYYLQRKKLTPRTLNSYLKSLEIFERWMDEKALTPEELRYQEIMDYVDHCREIGNTQNTIVQKIRVIKYYLDYRLAYQQKNPCDGWQLESRKAALPKLLTAVQIDQMYQDYPEENPIQIRNKMILGLMCYQALDASDLIRLLLEDVKLDYEMILIKRKAKRAGRSLKINPSQRPILEKYIQESRAQITSMKTPRLIVNKGKNLHLQNTIQGFYKDLYKRNPYLATAGQIRASVITNWLKTYNLREVQYMAGHKYVSSTERYQVNHIDDLQNLLDGLHPLK